MDNRQMIAQLVQALQQRQQNQGRVPAAPGQNRPTPRQMGMAPQPAAGGGPGRPVPKPATPRPNRPTPQTEAPPMVGPDRQPTGGVNARMNPLKRRMHEAMMNRGGWR